MVTAPRVGIFPGQAAVVNLSGERREDVVVRSAVAVPLVMTPPAGGGTFPGSTMGLVAYVRQVFLDTRYTAEQVRRYDQDARGKARPETDRTVQALQGALQAKVPFLLPAGNEVQIDRMIALGREFDVPAVLYGAHEGYAAAGRIAKARIPVIVSAKWPEKPKDADPDADELLETLELRDRAPRTPAALAEQKVPFAFSSDGLATPGEFLANVRKAIKAGPAGRCGAAGADDRCGPDLRRAGSPRQPGGGQDCQPDRRAGRPARRQEHRQACLRGWPSLRGARRRGRRCGPRRRTWPGRPAE